MNLHPSLENELSEQCGFITFQMNASKSIPFQQKVKRGVVVFAMFFAMLPRSYYNFVHNLTTPFQL